jgi:hypothetical protein
VIDLEHRLIEERFQFREKILPSGQGTRAVVEA